MTRFLFAFLLSLPLAFAAGCTPLGGNPPGDDDGGINDDDDASDDDDGADDDDDPSVLHITAPYGWVGDFLVDGDVVHEDDTECWVEFDDPEPQVEVSMQEEDLWICAWTFVNIPGDGATVELVDVWLEEGQCGLTPDDEYGDFDVYTEIEDGMVMINGLAIFPVPVTGNTFYGDGTSDGEHFDTLEGTIADDLSWIEFTLTWWHTGDQEWRVDEMTVSR